MEGKKNQDQEKLTETKLGLDIYRVSIIETMRQVGKAQSNTKTPKLTTVAYIQLGTKLGMLCRVEQFPPTWCRIHSPECPV